MSLLPRPEEELESERSLRQCYSTMIDQLRAENNTLRNTAREVRRLQKAYFGTRSKEALEAAKRAERELDGILKQA